ncbi:MAG TPA: hypothetical protein VME46_18845 [Acidimicrobiales bacterium]|nr:hypothetical protein [Acidimicrobiales bacterium]
MRPTTLLATAALFAAATSAVTGMGSLNSYTAHLVFSPNTAGSSTDPSAIGFTENYVVGGTAGNRPAPLMHIRTTIYGVVSNGKKFPTCSVAKILASGTDTACPTGALVATGRITAMFGPASDQSSSPGQTTPCDPVLDVWNAGQGKVVYFFVEGASSSCAGMTTGAIAPFSGTIRIAGKDLVMNTPFPRSVSYPSPNIELSLMSETLTWKNLSTKLRNGRTVPYFASITCKNGGRPYSTAFTAQPGPTAAPQSGTVRGVQRCE